MNISLEPLSFKVDKLCYRTSIRTIRTLYKSSFSKNFDEPEIWFDCIQNALFEQILILRIAYP